MIQIKTIALLLVFPLLLSGCGFKPMYASSRTDPSLQDTFSNVQISLIPDRIGQIVRNHLLNNINPFGEPSAAQYSLNVNIEEQIEGFGFRADEAVTRESFTLIASFELIDQTTGKIVFQDSLSSVQAYDVVQSDFASFSAQEDARLRTAERVSELITLRLGMYFKSTN